jgi:hypothetical protein
VAQALRARRGSDHLPPAFVSLVTVADVNAALARFGAAAIDPAELAPLAA